jgi:hypothetical protein
MLTCARSHINICVHRTVSSAELPFSGIPMQRYGGNGMVQMVQGMANIFERPLGPTFLGNKPQVRNCGDKKIVSLTPSRVL